MADSQLSELKSFELQSLLNQVVELNNRMNFLSNQYAADVDTLQAEFMQLRAKYLNEFRYLNTQVKTLRTGLYAFNKSLLLVPGQLGTD